MVKKKVKPKKVKPSKIIKQLHAYCESKFNQFDFDKAYDMHIDATFVRQLFDTAMAKTQYDSYNEECKYEFQINRARYVFYIMRHADVMDLVEIDMLIQQLFSFNTKLGADKFAHEVDEIFDIFEVKANAKDIRLSNVGLALFIMCNEMPEVLKEYDDRMACLEYVYVMNDLMPELVEEFGHVLDD